ncbi:MAG TPA: AAA family ATPase [Acidimicrobiales bacterium]|nr:AAA family ATPase [Acidimicrobiales bacterium]
MDVDIRMLGCFEVTTAGGQRVAAWPRRAAGSLVKLLALTPGRRLHRERVIDALWPDLTLVDAGPRLHKAAHYARRALGPADALVLRDDAIALFPDAEVRVDALAFDEAAGAALAVLDPVKVSTALELYTGELLPDDIYEPWTYQLRERIQRRYVDLLRGAGRWDDVLAIDPADEQAHLALLRHYAVAGDRSAALRQYERMERALHEELGVEPGPDAMAIRDRMRSLPEPEVESRGRSSTPVRSPTLVERDEVVEAMLATFHEAQRGLGRVVTVSGEAGVGKSALVRAFAQVIGDRATVLIGGCDDLLTASTFGPFKDIARGTPDALRAVLDGGDPSRVHELLLDMLSERPTVLVIEDVHWADDATLDAIRYLARRIPGVASLLVITFRDEEATPGHPLRRLLGFLAQGAASRVHLEPFSREAVDELAARAGVEVPNLHEITRGNPFFVSEVLAQGSEEVPATVRDAVLARIDGLPPGARTLLERLSVVPSGIERSLADALCDGAATEQLRVVERLGVLVGDSSTISFRHELARRAVEDSLTPAERVEHHARLAELLDAREADPARVMHHAVQANHGELVVKAGRAAASGAARVGAHRQVAEHLREVLRHDRLISATVRADILTKRSESLQLTNQFEESLRAAEAAVSVAEQIGDDERLALALLALGRTVLWARGPNAAQRAVRRAVTALEPDGDRELRAIAHADLSRALGELATVGSVAEGSHLAVEHATIALALAEQVGRADVRARALTYLGGERLAIGDGRGAADLDEAISLLREFPRAEFAVRACVTASGAAYRAGQLDVAERYVDLGLALARDTEFFSGEFRLALTRAAVRASRGQWSQAEAVLRDLLGRPGDPGIMAPLARSLLARLLARQGNFADAADVLAPAQRVADESDEIRLVGPVIAAQLELAWLSGTGADLLDVAQRAFGLAEACGHLVSRAELCRYLQRAGFDAPAVKGAPEPWASGLRGDWQRSADLWAARSEPYEQAMELLSSGNTSAVASGRRMLRELGAHGALAVTRTEAERA